MVVSYKDGGKSFGAIAMALRTYYYNHERTLLLRRTDVVIDAGYMETLLTDIVQNTQNTPELNELKRIVNELDIKVWKMGKYIALVSGEQDVDNIVLIGCGLSVAAGRSSSLKLDKVRFIIFDEFIANTAAGERYLKDEVRKLMIVWNNLDQNIRWKAARTTTLILLGNAFSSFNPYFEYFKINRKSMSNHHILVGDSWTCLFWKGNELLNELKNSTVYKVASKDQAYSAFAFENDFLYDITSLVVVPSKENYYFPYVNIYFDRNISITIYTMGSRLFVDRYRKNTKDWLVYDPKDVSKVKGGKSLGSGVYSTLVKAVKNYILLNRLSVADAGIAEVLFEIFL
jgi:hypothetical protein